MATLKEKMKLYRKGENENFECSECHAVYQNADVYYHDYRSWGDDVHKILCEKCYSRIVFYNIYDYTAEHSINFTPYKTEADDEDCTLYGVELETEKASGADYWNNDQTDIIKQAYPCRLARDGSLNSDGVEIISEPMSFRYWTSRESVIKNAFKELSHYRISHDSGSCGLHIHVTRPSEEVIDRILFIMEVYKNEFQKFARRRSSWARWLSEMEQYEDADEIKTIKWCHDKKCMAQGHSCALNLGNRNTIEFRIFKGTLKFETFFASLELVKNLVEACSDLNRPLSKITWKYITRTTYAHQYCCDNDITSEAVPKDLSRELLRKKRLLNDFKVKAIKILSKEFERAQAIKVDKTKFSHKKNGGVDTEINIYLRNINSAEAKRQNRIALLIRVANNIGSSVNIKTVKSTLSATIRQAELSSDTIENIEKLINEGEN